MNQSRILYIIDDPQLSNLIHLLQN